MVENSDSTETRVAERRDLLGVASLFVQYLAFYEIHAEYDCALSFLLLRIAKHESRIFVAESSADLVGFLQAYQTFSSLKLGPVWILNDLYVEPAARRSGVGRALIQKCVHEAQAAKVVGIELETAHGNGAARRLYEAERFTSERGFVRYTRDVGM